MAPHTSTTLSESEIAAFEKTADQWWDINGPSKPLHKLNPVRLSYIKRQICNHYRRDYDKDNALADLKILDVGCGGGLVCEPMARLGGTVTGIDAGQKAIATAIAHAAEDDLNMTYLCETSDNHQGQYDVILALEIIEHVANIPAFIESLSNLLKKGGLIIFSTLNRTPSSYLMGIVAAEYILRWLPAGTHDWKKFVKPSELAKHLRIYDLQISDVTGLRYNPLIDKFALSKSDIAVNYFLSATHNK